MTKFADLPVQRKLWLAMLATSSAALLLACAVILAVQFAGYRRNLIQNVSTLARILAENSTASIAFGDAAAAQQTLNALQAEPQITMAALFAPDGSILARYVAGPDEHLPQSPPAMDGVRIDGRRIVAVQPVIEGSRRLGTLYMRASLEVMLGHMRASLFTAIGALALSIVLAALLAVLLGRALAQPILGLASLADDVSAREDYSLRAEPYGADEIGRLTAAFNSMLARTQRSVDALRESERRFRVLADHAPVLIWLADAHRRFVWFNQQWLDFTGRPMDEELGNGWTERLHPDDREPTLRVYDAAFSSRRGFEIEFRLLRNDGEYRWILSQGQPRTDADQSFEGFIGSCIDVSDRKLAEQEIANARDRALAASRAKDNFLAALSHELRTPLTPVLLLASEEAANPRLPEEVRADFDMIAKNVALEARLIDDLLDLTRITRGKLVLDRKEMDAHLALQDALANVRPDFDDRRISLNVDLAAPRHHLVGDPVRIQQVFWNILKNAVKFTPPGGRVSVESSVVNRTTLSVRVTDTGIGMTPAEIARIFDAFAQGDHAESPGGHQFGGLGLGLAISQRLVELHSGTITASSAGRGKGSTFEISLPLNHS